MRASVPVETALLTLELRGLRSATVHFLSERSDAPQRPPHKCW